MLALAGAGLLALSALPPRTQVSTGGGPPQPEGPSSDPGALARQANQVLTTHCYRCHGENGAAEGGLNYIRDRDMLVARKKLVPGDAERSKLFRRVQKGEMPPPEEATRPGPAEVAVLKEWINAGAPAATSPAAPVPFLSNEQLATTIHHDLMSLPERDRRFARYFLLTHLANAGLSADELQTYRLALAKLVNSLSWNKEIVNPRPVDPARTILRIDIRDYTWNDSLWGRILAAYPHGLLPDTPEARTCFEVAGEQLPFLRADWFVAAAARPPLYHELLQLPASEGALEAQLHIDLLGDVRQERVARAGFNGSGVSRNNRVIERHASPYGAYWRSYDFASNVGRRNLFAHPLGPGPEASAFEPDGGEVIFNLPNGLHAFLLVDGRGRRLDKAPIAIVSDPRRGDRAVENGVSCMSCHARGLIPKADQVRAHMARNRGAFTPTEADTIRALYPPEATLADLFARDNERYRKAVERTGGRLTVTEPVAALVWQYEKELDLKTAAAELGLRPEELSQRLDQSPDLGRELGPLRVANGTVQRQVFNDAFADLVRELQLGRYLHTGRREAD
ncbi:MAG TPA: c-type cytochrome domain-containing protein [Gemmataceae bacterium]|nr:c-type cytochrome domain-containing protein [Gemmataceae bacterium]